MSSWAYGLVEIEKGKGWGKELAICEVYFDKKVRPTMFIPITWVEIKSQDIKRMVLEDITSQFKHNIQLMATQNKAGNWSIRRGAKKK